MANLQISSLFFGLISIYMCPVLSCPVLFSPFQFSWLDAETEKWFAHETSDPSELLKLRPHNHTRTRVFFVT